MYIFRARETLAASCLLLQVNHDRRLRDLHLSVSRVEGQIERNFYRPNCQGKPDAYKHSR